MLHIKKRYTDIAYVKLLQYTYVCEWGLQTLADTICRSGSQSPFRRTLPQPQDDNHHHRMPFYNLYSEKNKYKEPEESEVEKQGKKMLTFMNLYCLHDCF